MNKYIPKRIAELEEYKPSSGVYDIRLDANECPFNTPSWLIDELKTELDKLLLNRYPDSSASALVEQFCRVYGCKKECTVAGCGSDELISLIVNVLLGEGDSIIVTKPDFSMYSFYASLAGCKVISVGKGDGFEIDFEGMKEAVGDAGGAKAVFFSNPCNPTGRIYSKDVILDFVKSVDCPVIVDEAYMEFASANQSVLDCCGELDNLIVLKTLSKAYGAAALRCGFAVCPEDITSSVMKIKSPYNLNSYTQAAGTALLRHSDEVNARTAEIINGTQKLYSRLKEMGFHVYETACNFVLIGFDDDVTAGAIYEYLKTKSIIIRNPDRRHIRITCGTDDENRCVLDALKEYLGR